MSEPDDLITINEAARMLGISSTSMRRLIERGRIPSDSVFRPPGSKHDWTLLRTEDVKRYAEERKQLGDPDE